MAPTSRTPPPAAAVTEAPAGSGPPVDLGRVFRAWLPLAASWLLMSVELPLLAAVVGRLPDDTVNLAAYGSVVFPVALVFEAPIIMLLAASTALCTHGRAYLQVRRFMRAAGAALTLAHAAVAFTPLFDVVADTLMGIPGEVREPARLGLMIMLPWTWSIAYRRFHQGVLIRFGHGRVVWRGTLVRLAANAAALAFGALVMRWPGIAVGSVAIVTGVVCEAAFVGYCVQPVLRDAVFPAPATGEPLGVRSFLHFYVPLALTPLITLLIQPIGAASMARMGWPLESLAAWPAVHGVVFMARSVGMAFNEVVVSLLGAPGAVPALRRFQRLLSGAAMSVLAVLALPPVARRWFGGVSGLPDEVAGICVVATALSVLMPGYAALQSLYQGALVRRRTTRPVTEAVALYFALSAGLLLVGIARQGGGRPGIYWTVASFVTAGVTQTAWLWWRSRAALAHFAQPVPGDRRGTGDDRDPGGSPGDRDGGGEGRLGTGPRERRCAGGPRD